MGPTRSAEIDAKYGEKDSKQALWPNLQVLYHAEVNEATTTVPGTAVVCNPDKKKRGPKPPLPGPANPSVFLTEECQNRPLALGGEGQGVDAQLLPCLQGQQVGAFLVEVRKR